MVGSDLGLLQEQSGLENARYNRQQSNITISLVFEGNETLMLVRKQEPKKANLLLLLLPEPL